MRAPHPHISFVIVLLVAIVVTVSACSGDADSTTTLGSTTTAPTTTIGVTVESEVEPTYTVGQDVEAEVGDRIQTTFEDLRGQVEALRGLVFLDPPRVVILADTAFTARHGAFIESRLDAPALAVDTDVLRLMALLSGADDLRAILLDVSDQPVAAFYDPAAGEVVLAAGSGSLDPVARTDVVRSLNAALTDQYHLVADRVAAFRADGRNDEATALEALWVSDANYSVALYTQGLGDDERTTIADAAPPVPGVPAYVEEQLRLSGETGLAFVEAMIDEGGVRSLDAVYAADLFTTEHLMHPNRFLGGERLREITPVTAELAGATIATSGSLGEGALRGMLVEALAPDMLTQTADGWGSDESATYTTPGDVVFVYTLRGDSVDDTLEITQGFLSHAETVMGFGGAVAARGGVEYVGSARSGSDYMFIDRDGDGLVVVIATDADMGRTLAAAVPIP